MKSRMVFVILISVRPSRGTWAGVVRNYPCLLPRNMASQKTGTNPWTGVKFLVRTGFPDGTIWRHYNSRYNVIALQKRELAFIVERDKSGTVRELLCSGTGLLC